MRSRLKNPRFWIALPYVLLIIGPVGAVIETFRYLVRALHWVAKLISMLCDAADVIGTYILFGNELVEWVNNGDRLGKENKISGK